MLLVVLEDGRENANGILVHVLFDPLQEGLVEGTQLLVVLLVVSGGGRHVLGLVSIGLDWQDWSIVFFLVRIRLREERKDGRRCWFTGSSRSGGSEPGEATKDRGG